MGGDSLLYCSPMSNVFSFSFLPNLDIYQCKLQCGDLIVMVTSVCFPLSSIHELVGIYLYIFFEEREVRVSHILGLEGIL